GIAALAGLVALALATTLPLPPAVLRWIAPATTRLYSEMLPGWPGAGGWALWRPLALDPYAAWATLGRFSIGLGAFAVCVSYPWRSADHEGDARRVVFARLLLTLIAGGVLLACLGLLSELAGNGRILWVTGVPASSERASGAALAGAGQPRPSCSPSCWRQASRSPSGAPSTRPSRGAPPRPST